MIGATMAAGDYLALVCKEIQNLDTAQVENVSELIEQAYDSGRFVFIIGNGGSGANASHLCEDLAKCTLCDFEHQKRLKVLSLTDRLESVSVGFQPDPANPDVVAAASVTGTEMRTTQEEGKPPQTSRSQFVAILWFGRPSASQRYLVCDAGT